MAQGTLSASRTAEIVNPVIAGTLETFESMVGLTLKKVNMELLQGRYPFHEVTAVIQLSGNPRGSICLSVERRAAFALVKKMVDENVTEITPLVVDTVAEFTNVVAGCAKANLSHLDLEMGLPNVVLGTDCRIAFPSPSVPMAVHFASPLGRIMVAFAFSS